MLDVQHHLIVSIVFAKSVPTLCNLAPGTEMFTTYQERLAQTLRGVQRVPLCYVQAEPV
jgi:hypothetical protein